MKEQKEQTNNKKNFPNQSMLFLKGVIGGYLVYLAYDIILTEMAMESRIGIMAAAGFFVIAGVVLVIMTVRSFIRGEYIGGKADLSEGEYEEENHQHFGNDSANDNDSEWMQ